MHELDPNHQAIAEAARARVMQLISQQTRVLLPEVMVVTEVSDE